MKTNEGKVDRIIRIVLGVVIILVGIIFNSWLLGVIGLIPLITGIIGWCGIYQVLGIDTSK